MRATRVRFFPSVRLCVPQGSFLLSGSSDKSAIVWDVSKGEVQQQFRFHEAPTLVSYAPPRISTVSDKRRKGRA